VTRWSRQHPFLIVGLATFGLFLLVESVSSLARVAPVATQILRVLIVPLWLMRTLELIIGVDSWPGIIQFVVALPLLFAPYVLADWVLARIRAHRASSLKAAAV
jgi:hypothetical protein